MDFQGLIWFEHLTDPLGEMYYICVDSGQVRLTAADTPANESDEFGAADKRTARVATASVDTPIDSAGA